MRVEDERGLSGCSLAVAMRPASSELPSRGSSGVGNVEMPREIGWEGTGHV